MAANEIERQRWNLPDIAETWPLRERLTTEVTAPLLARLAPQPGERILEIGSGGGLASIAAAQAVGPGGSVTGFDLSEPLVGLATRRAAEAGVANARFAHGDAQTGEMPGGPFDAMISQFGVMFFADPVAAFANIRRHLRPGARLIFACWQSGKANNWFPGEVIRKYARVQPAPSATGAPTGPFAFADPAHVGGVLEGAGFRDIGCEPFTQSVAVPDDTIADPGRLKVMQVPEEQMAEAQRELDALTESFRGADGLLHFTLAAQFITASNPA